MVIRQGATKPDLEYAVYDDAGAPPNLAGVTSATLTLSYPSGASITRPLELVAPDAAGGFWRLRYVWQSGDTNEPGIAYVRVTLSDGAGGLWVLPGEGYAEIEIRP